MAANQFKVVGQEGNMAVSAPELRLTNEVLVQKSNKFAAQIFHEINFGIF